jgi:recombination protein RecT
MTTTRKQNLKKLQDEVQKNSVQKLFQSAMGRHADMFTAGLIEIASSNNRLAECQPGDLIRESLRAATLGLPLNRNLGFAWLVPRRDKNGRWRPCFQLGWKGYIQLAQNTQRYEWINKGVVYEGENVQKDRISGKLQIEGEPTSDKAIGYFAGFRTIDGFQKESFWTTTEIVAHMKRYAQGYDRPDSSWRTSFDKMALKTVLKHLLADYGPLGTKRVAAATGSHGFDPDGIEEEIEQEQTENIGSARIISGTGEVVDAESPPKTQPELEPGNKKAKKARGKNKTKGEGGKGKANKSHPTPPPEPDVPPIEEDPDGLPEWAR